MNKQMTAVWMLLGLGWGFQISEWIGGNVVLRLVAIGCFLPAIAISIVNIIRLKREINQLERDLGRRK